MELTTHDLGNVRILAVRGRIDHAHADAFQAALDPHLAACVQKAPAVVLDFSGVEYISSVGLRVLMIAARRVAAQGGRIAIAGLQPLVREVFEISRFNLVLKVFDTVEAAAGAPA